jgi:hypothetical protein
MKSKAKIDRLAHKYALDISKFHEKSVVKIDFNNLNKDFYDDIETNDTMIKSDKKLLHKIKNKTLKEFIYTNKIIPDLWKNKINYQSEMTNLISKDKKLLSYIGSYSNNNNQFIGILPKINTTFNNNITNNDNVESRTDKIRRTFRFKKNELDKDDLKLILNDYKVVYPIKEKLEILVNNYDLNIKEASKENNDLDESDKNYTHKLGDSKFSNNFSILKKINPINKKERMKIQRSFRQNIFSLDSLKQNNNDKTILNKNRKIIQKKNFELKNKTIELGVKEINYYGPHFSFCPTCKNKNLEFYNYMEPNQCLELINHIKYFRKYNNIYMNKNYTNQTDIKNKRSSSVPKLSLLNEKESEAESEENTYNVFF